MDNFKRTVRLLIEAYFLESEVVIHPEKFEDSEKIEMKSGDALENEQVNEDVNEEVNEEVNDMRTPPMVKSVKPAFIIPKNSLWAVQFQRRSGMTTLDRDAVVEVIGSMVGTGYTVNLGQPEYSILVEVNNVRNLILLYLYCQPSQTFCGMSVVRDYTRLKRYNLHRICHPELEERNTK